MYGQLADFVPKYQLRIHGLAGFYILGLFEFESIATLHVQSQKTNQEDYELFTIETKERRFYSNGRWN